MKNLKVEGLKREIGIDEGEKGKVDLEYGEDYVGN